MVVFIISPITSPATLCQRIGIYVFLLIRGDAIDVPENKALAIGKMLGIISVLIQLSFE